MQSGTKAVKKGKQTGSGGSKTPQVTPPRAASPAGSPLAGIPLLPLGVIVVVVAGIALIFFSGSNNSVQLPSQITYLPRVNGTIPRELSGFASGQNPALTIATLTKSHIANVTNLTVIYNGSLTAKPPGTLGAVLTISSPMRVVINRYKSSKRVYINASGIPAIGSAQITYLNTTNGTSVCTNLNTTALSRGDASHLGAAGGSTCTKSSTLLGFDFEKLSNFNFSQLSQIGIKLQYQNEYPSIYNGVPCTFISGSITQVDYNNNQVGSGNFGFCVANKSFLPLDISGSFQSQQSGSGTLTIGEYGAYNNSLPYQIQ